MELELKHIQHYPIGGYNALNITDGCEVKLVDGIYTFDNKKEFWYKSCGWNLHRDSWKPLLLPMSSLYKEMQDGKVHIVELAKIATGLQDWEVIEYLPTFGSLKIKFKPYLIAYNKEYNFRFFFRDKDFYLYDVDGARECTHQNQLDLFNYLFENHFDVFGLIDKGLALDKTKIK